MSNKNEKIFLTSEVNEKNNVEVRKVNDQGLFEPITSGDMLDIGFSSFVETLKGIAPKIGGTAGVIKNSRLTGISTVVTYAVYHASAKAEYGERAATIAAVQTTGDALFSSVVAWAGGLAGAELGLACGPYAPLYSPVSAVLDRLVSI